MMDRPNRGLLPRILLGALLGAFLAPLTVLFLTSFSVRTAPSLEAMGSMPMLALAGLVTPAMAETFGVLTAVVLQSALGGLLGAVVLTSTMPFAEDGKALVLNSLWHFSATAAAFALLLGVCRWVEWCYIPMWLGLLVVVYLIIWLGRYVGWYMELVQLRSGLGLDPGPSVLKWRETLAYLPFLALLCDVLPLLARLCDPRDVPVFSGILLPFLVLPLAGVCAGLSLGKRLGVCPLFPVLAFVLYLPMVFFLYNISAMFHCWIAAGSTLVGNLAGTILRHR